MNTRWLAVAVLAVCAGACSTRAPQPAPEPEEPAPTASAEDLKALADGNNAFAVDLYKKLAEKEQGNLIFSPYSVRTALAMTYAGARGKTAEEMRKVLHFALPDERLHPAFGATAYQLKGGKDKQHELNVANALWGQKGFPFRPEFLELTRTNYGAGFREVDFIADPEAARQAINHWVEEKTQDRIKELLQPGAVNQGSRLVLTNAVYFKGQWEKPFNPRLTADAQFRVTSDRTVLMQTMSQSGEFGYGEADDAQLLRLPYRASGESGLAMVIVLPKAVDGLPRLEAQLSGTQVQKWFGSIWNRNGHVSLPKFKVVQKFSLGRSLRDLGMPLAFEEPADFSGITPGGDFFIQDVIHKAMAEVDEEGTVAAAATAVVGGRVSAPAEPFQFHADHPFLFFIRDAKSGLVLFVGRMSDPCPIARPR
ncbi:MAG: serpin family protein [Planctomycetes bacterium]|nr:serpin family protein [Planctomycetota bacterium]